MEWNGALLRLSGLLQQGQSGSPLISLQQQQKRMYSLVISSSDIKMFVSCELSACRNRCNPSFSTSLSKNKKKKECVLPCFYWNRRPQKSEPRYLQCWQQGDSICVGMTLWSPHLAATKPFMTPVSSSQGADQKWSAPRANLTCYACAEFHLRAPYGGRLQSPSFEVRPDRSGGSGALKRPSLLHNEHTACTV